METEELDLSAQAQRTAATQMRRSHVRNGGKRRGRPRDGKEKKVRITNRWEPAMLAELQAATGCDTRELVVRFHGLLRLFSEYYQAKGALDRELAGLGLRPLDKAS